LLVPLIRPVCWQGCKGVLFFRARLSLGRTINCVTLPGPWASGWRGRIEFVEDVLHFAIPAAPLLKDQGNNSRADGIALTANPHLFFDNARRHTPNRPRPAHRPRLGDGRGPPRARRRPRPPRPAISPGRRGREAAVIRRDDPGRRGRDVGVSLRTANREWAFARAWLAPALARE
jgi:hypothetical protein